MDKKPTQDASMLGKIIGYNNRSGLLYTTMCGMNQFKPKENVIVKPPDTLLYENPQNINNTLKSMNADKPPNVYRGKRRRLVVRPELQPSPFSLGGKSQ